MQRTRGTLGPDLHRRVIDELGDTAFIIWYFSTGEPLLNKRLLDIVSATRSKEIYSAISTNLSLPLTDERIDGILECGLGLISVSCDGASADTYSRYRVGGDFDLVLSNLKRLVTRKRQLGLNTPVIEWRYLVFHHNQHEIARARARAFEIGVDLLEFFPGYTPSDPAPGAVRSADPLDLEPSLSGPALEKAAERPPTTLERYLRSAPAQPPTEIPGARFGSKCDWLYFGSTLFPNGSVGPCCVSNEEVDDFGRLDETTTFESVWGNSRYVEARSLFANGGWDQSALVCSRCPNRDAQDYQFRTTTRALLRNAPDWVLKALSADPDEYFFAVDYQICPEELSPIRAGLLALPAEYPEIERQLAEKRGRDFAYLRETLHSSP